MAKSKGELIKSLNEIKQSPLAEFRKTPTNLNQDNAAAAMQYNAMLDNITIGAGTTYEFEFAGIEWKLRLLTAREFVDIKIARVKAMKDESMFEDFYFNYLTYTKILAKAMTPNPFCPESKIDGIIFTEQDLSSINEDILEEVYRRYIHWVHMATKKVDEFTDEEIEALITIVKKKPEVLRELDRRQSLIVMVYLHKSLANMEKIVKPDVTN